MLGATIVSELLASCHLFFFFQAEDGIRDVAVTGVQTCALPICAMMSADIIALAGRFLQFALAGACCGRGRCGACMRHPSAIVIALLAATIAGAQRSGERRVGEEGRSRWAPDH